MNSFIIDNNGSENLSEPPNKHFMLSATLQSTIYKVRTDKARFKGKVCTFVGSFAQLFLELGSVV